MEPSFGAILFFVMVGLLALIVILSATAGPDESTTDWVKQRGWKYYDDLPASLETAVNRFDFYNKGFSSRTKHVLCGEYEGFEACTLEFSFNYGDSRHQIGQTIALLKIDNETPSFALLRKQLGILDIFSDMVTSKWVKVNVDPRLLELYRVVSYEPDRAKSLFSAELTKFFIDKPDFSVEVSHGYLAIYSMSNCYTGENLEIILRRAVRVANRLTGDIKDMVSD